VWGATAPPKERPRTGRGLEALDTLIFWPKFTHEKKQFLVHAHFLHHDFSLSPRANPSSRSVTAEAVDCFFRCAETPTFHLKIHKNLGY